MKALGSLILATAMLGGCASAGMSDVRVPGLNGRQASTPSESFAYVPASNRDIRVSVSDVALRGTTGFIPADPNWIQMRITVANESAETISLNNVKVRLTDGRVVPSASAVSELLKPPSLVNDGMMQLGVGTAGMIAGTFIFPPLALASGVAMAIAPMMRADRNARLVERAMHETLPVGSIAPGTSVSGLIWAPAVTGQTGLVVFYQAHGAERTLVVERSAS